MIGRVCRWWVVAVIGIAGLQPGCADKTRTLACSRSAASACAADPPCAPTWADVLADTTLCAGATPTSPLRADCGPYHVLTVTRVDTALSYYYDGATGTLVAIVLASSSTGMTTCPGGPSGGFALPTCAGAGSEPLPQCTDGGADAPVADAAAD
jgi:hypothetical protein